MIHFLGSNKFLQPRELSEVVNLMSQFSNRQQQYFLFSGGTDLVPNLKNYPELVGTVISLSKVQELREVRMTSQKTIEIGSQTRLSELHENELIKKQFPGLALAASKIASPQIRNQASVGGNLLVNNRCRFFNQSPLNRSYHDECYKAGGNICHVIANAQPGDAPLCRARFVSDLAPVLMVLGAKLNLLGPMGKRSLDINEFYLPDGIRRNQLEVNEVLCSIEIMTSPKRQAVYEKLRIRNAIDFASVGLALGWVGEASERQWHLALTGVHTHPIIVSSLETDNAGATVDALAKAAGKLAQPLKQDFLSPSYRRRMIPVFARRALARLEG